MDAVSRRPARPASAGRARLAPEWGLALAIAIVIALIYALDRRGSFFSEYSRVTMLHQVALFGVLSVGVAVVIIAGGIDLSLGSVVALTGVVCAKLLTDWLPRYVSAPPLALAAIAFSATILLGVVIGLLHALLINAFRLPPFIATLATMAGLRSAARLITQSTVPVADMTYRRFGYDAWWSLGVFAVVATTLSLMMGVTVRGRHLYALGGNETAARLNGLPTRRLKTFTYVLSGALAALGGLLFLGKNGLGDPETGVSYELYAITAAVVGGCSLSGGVGSIRGTVLGLVLLQIVIKGTSQIAYWVDSSRIEGLVLGTVVVGAVAINQRFRVRG